MTSEDRAFILAPLAMPFACVAGYLGFDFSAGLLNYLSSVLIIGLYGLPVVYVIEFFLGYRFYRLFLKRKILNIFTITGGSIVLANIPTFFISIFSMYVPSKHSVLDVLGLFSFIGLTVGLTFWLLLNLEKIKRGMQKSA